MAAKYVISQTTNDQFRFSLRAGNGEEILASETYVSKSGAQNGIESVKKNGVQDDRYDRKTSTNGQHYFVLKAANGEPIGTSEMYTTESAMENGIASVKKNAPEAETRDDS